MLREASSSRKVEAISVRKSEPPATSRYLDVLDSRIHYIEAGAGGDPVVFFHGNPTSSFLWRNILPYAAQRGRAVAFDLIGMGRSGKPDIEYTFDDHLRYARAFLKELDLSRYSLVLHDWGGPLGLTCALDDLERVKSITVMETFLEPVDWRRVPLSYRALFSLFRCQPTGYVLNQALNVFVRELLPHLVAPGFVLAPDIRAAYQAPFPTIRSRRPVAVWPRQIPSSPAHPVWGALCRIRDELRHCGKPTLFLYAEPGALITAENRDRIRQLLPPGAEAVYVGPGLHYIQENRFAEIGRALQRFLEEHHAR